MQANHQYDVIVIGAGPAGILAGGRASMLGVRVAILEKMEKPARKLRITGKGRCNITNEKPFDEFIQNITPNPRFLNTAFGVFFTKQIIDLLEENGLKTVTERGQRVFPASGKAWDVAETLVKWAKKQGVTFYNHTPVKELLVEGGTSRGVILENNQKIQARAIIVATGGKSYPATGSTGDGYKFAMQVGHTITALRPSLAGIETHPTFPALDGLNLRNVKTSILTDNQKVAEEFGEVEFTDYGLDGPCILRLSLQAVDLFTDGKKVSVSIDLKPALDPDKLQARISRGCASNENYTVAMLLRNLLPSQLVTVFLRQLRLNSRKKASEMTDSEREKVIALLKNFTLQMTGYRGWDEAIVTAGGIALSEVNSKTMESKLIDGLYFAGEILDLSGNTGGYNLQIAFSTGWLAAESAVKKLSVSGEGNHSTPGFRTED